MRCWHLSCVAGRRKLAHLLNTDDVAGRDVLSRLPVIMGIARPVGRLRGIAVTIRASSTLCWHCPAAGADGGDLRPSVVTPRLPDVRALPHYASDPCGAAGRNRATLPPLRDGCRCDASDVYQYLPKLPCAVDCCQASLGFSNAILDMAALGFLGMGAQPPTLEWGTMLSDVLQFAQSCLGGSSPSRVWRFLLTVAGI